jgi:PEP-CTERM motif
MLLELSLKMKSFITGGILVLAVALAPQIVRAQPFTNLNFESPTIITSSPSGYGFNFGTARIPGWTTYGSYFTRTFESGGDPTIVLFNNQGLDSASVSLVGTNYWTPAIQGNYSVLLFGGTFAYQQVNNTTNGASIGQTGQIPLTAQSLTYWGDALQVSFNGQPLSLMDISNTLNYTIWGADISAFAGQTGQLLFTAPGLTYGSMLDNIQFSSLPIPEPGVLGLFGLGGLAFLWHRRKAKVV